MASIGIIMCVGQGTGTMEAQKPMGKQWQFHIVNYEKNEVAKGPPRY